MQSVLAWAIMIAIGYVIFAIVAITPNFFDWHLAVRIIFGLYVIGVTLGTIQLAAQDAEKQKTLNQRRGK